MSERNDTDSDTVTNACPASLDALIRGYHWCREQGLDVPIELAHAIGLIEGERRAMARMEAKQEDFWHGQG